jgi:CubicO group peptidase (beta-lactamase class C family)
MGSTFKPMSAVALMQLMEQGKFKLDDRVNDYLQEFRIRGEGASNPVTFRHILTHTSGLPAALGFHPLWGDTLPPPISQFLQMTLEVQRAPLEKFEASNLGYTLIAYLVEKLSGVPYKDYIRRNIWDPLEMGSTAFEPTPEMEERSATPYVVDPASNRPLATGRVRADIWPAGIVYGTVINQANFMIANLNGGMFKGKKLLKASTLSEMHRLQYEKVTGPTDYGWGNDTTGQAIAWMASRRNGERYIAHSGSGPGFTAFLLGNLDRRVGVAILSNGSRVHAHLGRLADQTIDIFTGR